MAAKMNIHDNRANKQTYIQEQTNNYSTYFGEKNEKKIEFDVALSFAAEQQEFVNKVYHYLRAYNLKVFFAPECQDILVGKNQREIFMKIFGIISEYIVLFVSKNYIVREVPMEEANIAFHSHEIGKIIPVCLDEARLPNKMLNPKELNYYCSDNPAEIAIKIFQIIKATRTTL